MRKGLIWGMGYPASTQGMRLSAEARRPQCPGGHARDSARRLAPLPPPGFHARILLDASVFFTARTGPPGRAVHFWEFSASRGGCIRAGSVFLISRNPSTGDLGWRAAPGASIARVSRRALPQSDADRAAFPVCGAAGGGRDAENSGFCTARAGVRWGGKGRLRLFMHDLSEVMQDDRAPCAGYPYWARHAPDVRRVRSAPYANQKVRAVSLHCAMPGDNSFYLLGGLSAEKVFTAAEDDVSYRLPNRVAAKQLYRSVCCV